MTSIPTTKIATPQPATVPSSRPVHCSTMCQLAKAAITTSSTVTARTVFASSPSHLSHGKSAGSGISIAAARSEEHTSELQSLMRHSYDVFCLKKQNANHHFVVKT